jgi:hypothetical protein
MALGVLAFAAYKTFNGECARQRSKALFVPLDFSAATGSNGGAITIDFELIEQAHQLEFVQAVFIDNTLTAQAFSLTASISQHTLTVAAGKQAFLPIFAPEGAKYLAQLAAADAHLVKVQFLNFPVAAIVW